MIIVAASGFGALDKLSLIGGTMAGDINLAGNPAASTGAIPQSYADSGFAGVVVWTGTTWPARSATIGTVIWVGGTVQPPTGAGGFVNGDIWIAAGGGGSGGTAGGSGSITDASGNIWVPVVTGTTAGGYQATVVWVPAMQDEANGAVTDQAGGLIS